MDNARDAAPPVGDHGEPSAPAALAAEPATASDRLRAAREARGMTTADVAARTRITLRHVNALDRGDLASLPGRPYVLGFVRNYARVVGLDEADMAALARSEIDAAAPLPAPRVVHQFDVEDPAKTPSRMVTWLALGLCLVIVAAGAVFWRSYYVPSTDLPSLTPPETPAPAAPVATRAPARLAPTPAGPVVFTAREDGIWVKFYDGQGKQLMQKQLALGESYTVPADAVDPKLWTGRPDALTITVGGAAVPPLSDHRGIMRDVPVNAQALLARSPPAPAAAPPVAAAMAPRSARRRPHRIDHRTDHRTGAAPADAASPGVAPAPAASTSDIP